MKRVEEKNIGQYIENSELDIEKIRKIENMVYESRKVYYAYKSIYKNRRWM